MGKIPGRHATMIKGLVLGILLHRLTTPFWAMVLRIQRRVLSLGLSLFLVGSVCGRITIFVIDETHGSPRKTSIFPKIPLKEQIS